MTYKSRISLSIYRLVNFLGMLTRNRRGALGVGVLITFIGMASAAPLLTPYDPVWDYYVAGDYGVPIWFRYLPGGSDLTGNLEVVTQPGFPTSASLAEWNFTKTTSSALIDLRYEHLLGCAAVDFTREAGTGYSGVAKAYLTKKFFYPYTGSPRVFRCYITVSTEGADDLERINIKVSLERVEENGTVASYPLWIEDIYEDSPSWITPSPAIDSYASKSWVYKYFGSTMVDPAAIVFSKDTDYLYAVEIDFIDSKPGTLAKDVKATVYVDDLNTKLFGNSFGLLGTDHKGRDIFTQLVHGARLSLMVGLLSAILSVGIGLIFGLISAYLGGISDEIIMRFTDMLLVLPGLPLLLVLIAVLGASLWNLVILIGVLGWMGFARIVRSQVLSIKERPFIEAAKAVGAGKFHIIGKHILPNVMSLVYVSLALSVPIAILNEAALSWLGLFDPNVMSWGRMLYDVQINHGVERWWWVVPPGLCIAVVSLSFILLGYALDEVLNPKLRRRR